MSKCRYKKNPGFLPFVIGGTILIGTAGAIWYISKKKKEGASAPTAIAPTTIIAGPFPTITQPENLPEGGGSDTLVDKITDTAKDIYDQASEFVMGLLPSEAGGSSGREDEDAYQELPGGGGGDLSDPLRIFTTGV